LGLAIGLSAVGILLVCSISCRWMCTSSFH
jgi:hypothetical protein